MMSGWIPAFDREDWLFSLVTLACIHRTRYRYTEASGKWKAVDSMMLTKEKAQKIGCGVLKMLKRKACSKALEMLAGTKHVIEKEMFNANGKSTALASRLTSVAFHACGRLEGASPSQLLLLTMEADNSL